MFQRASSNEDDNDNDNENDTKYRFTDQKQSLCSCVLHFGRFLCRPLQNNNVKCLHFWCRRERTTTNICFQLLWRRLQQFSSWTVCQHLAPFTQMGTIVKASLENSAALFKLHKWKQSRKHYRKKSYILKWLTQLADQKDIIGDKNLLQFTGMPCFCQFTEILQSPGCDNWQRFYDSLLVSLYRDFTMPRLCQFTEIYDAPLASIYRDFTMLWLCQFT